MFYNSPLSIFEKVYLSDGSLSYAQDLKVGDKVLSIKITQDNIKDISDIFTKIIAGDRVVHDYEMCEATVYSVESQKMSQLTYVNTSRIQKNQYIAIKLNNLGFKGYESKINEIAKKKDNTVMPFTLANIQEMEVDRALRNNTSCILQKNSEDVIVEMPDFSITENKGFDQSYSLTLDGGHFYFTKNFIVLANGVG
jgi:hypothetical protein